MYVPPAFREDDPAELAAMIAAARLATLVTATPDGMIATPLPLLFDPGEGAHGTLYGHVARANPQWRHPADGDALALFAGPDAYVSPSWYAAKAEHGKVVPTWNYIAVHAYGPVEFFDEPDRLLAVVSRLSDLHEAGRERPWSVTDAPEAYVAAQLRGIVGLRLAITRIEGKRKLSQNRSASYRVGVATGLAGAAREEERALGAMIPIDTR
jgi:transcriptional regulator